MELSKQERLILYNQYGILKRLNPEESKEYGLRQKILEWGYEHDYNILFGMMSEELPEEVADFVWDVFQMYRVLMNSYNKLSDEEKKTIDIEDLKFEGYDGNNESGHLCYAEFILNDLNLYDEVKTYCKDVNSHWYKVDKYTRMLVKWKEVREKEYSILTLEQMKRVIGE